MTGEVDEGIESYFEFSSSSSIHYLRYEQMRIADTI